MINANEVQTIKNNWRLFTYFAGLMGAVLIALYVGGFVQLPASAGDVQTIQDTVIQNKQTINRVDEIVRSLHLDVEVNKTATSERNRSYTRRLKSIEDSQIRTESSVEEILQLMIKNNN